MSNSLIAAFSNALIAGTFAGIQIKTGQDVSPEGVTQTATLEILKALNSPLFAQYKWFFAIVGILTVVLALVVFAFASWTVKVATATGFISMVMLVTGFGGAIDAFVLFGGALFSALLPT